MGEVHNPKQAVINEKLITIAKRSEHCPDSLGTCLLNEKGMQEQESLQGQSIIAQTLQALAVLSRRHGMGVVAGSGIDIATRHAGVALGCNQLC